MTVAARRWFLFGLVFEATLGGLGLVGSHLLALPWRKSCGLADIAWGVAATLPLLGLLTWLRKTSAPPILRIRAFLDIAVRPVLGDWSLWQLAMMSAVAGVGEELLFRGCIQGELSILTGRVGGLLLASALFGCFHAVTRAYAVLAGFIGLYLGLVWILSGSLVSAMLAHALYDLVALIWFVRVR